MGLACKIFEIIWDALVYILKTLFNITNIVKVLDDFLFGEITEPEFRISL